VISVVIPAWRAGPGLAACLESLRGQDVEVIVVASGGDDVEFPGVTVLRYPERLFPGEARNRGIEAARGDLIALLDADCEVAPDWAERLRAWHRGSPFLLATALAPPDSGLLAWAAWFCRCARWAPQTPAGPRRDLPSATMSFPRSLFAECGPFLGGTWSSDTAFCWEARRHGYPLWFEPTVVVRHHDSPTFKGFLARQYRRGLAFARVRRARAPEAHLRLLGYLPAPLALVLFARLTSAVLRHRIHPGRFARVWPLVLAGHLAWAWGEAEAYRQ